jgi:N-acylglucosamine-6-phosphate 2-epimerase
MAAMAQAAVEGGAVAIRAEGVADIRRIRQVVGVPIIGLIKRDVAGERRITHTIEEAVSTVEAGADIVAVDLTDRPREDGLSAAEHMQRLQAEVGRPVLADVSNVHEGVVAAASGAACVGSTLSGYTAHSPQIEGPDLNLISELVASVDVPVVAEGRYRTSEQVADAFARGAHAVVIGTAITNTLQVTRWFVEASVADPATTRRQEG